MKTISEVSFTVMKSKLSLWISIVKEGIRHINFANLNWQGLFKSVKCSKMNGVSKFPFFFTHRSNSFPFPNISVAETVFLKVINLL